MILSDVYKVKNNLRPFNSKLSKSEYPIYADPQTIKADIKLLG